MGLLKISSFELHLGSNLTRNTLIKMHKKIYKKIRGEDTAAF